MNVFKRLLCIAVCLFSFCLLHAQLREITGTVLSQDDNTPLQGVTVTNLTTSQRVQTNAAGFFTIQAEKGHVLAFTYVGFVRLEQAVGDANTVSVKLSTSGGQLEDVVVTAYGVRREKKQLAYSVTEIDGDDIAQTKRDNFINALAGRVPGATITSTSGLPGSSATIILRGATSIGGNNQPLFVVDGVPYDNQTLNQENLIGSSSPSGVGFVNRNADYNNRAMDLNSEDIETVTVLKGPEATALYGSQGAAGVILITTKKGKAGKGTITYDNNFGWANVYRFPEVQTVYGRGTNGLRDNTVASFFGPKYPDSTRFYDNIEAFFRTGTQQQHSLSFDGGGGGSTFRLSGSYLQNNGVVPSAEFDRLTVRLTSNNRISPKLAIAASANYVNTNTSKISKGANSPLLALLYFPRDFDITQYLTPTGTRRTYRGGTFASELDNPFWDVNKNGGEDKTNRLTANATLTFDPFKWLTLTGIAGRDGYNTEGSFVNHPQSFYGSFTNGFISGYDNSTNNTNYQLRGSLKHKIWEVNNVLLLGTNIDDYKTNINAYKGEQFFENDFKNINNTKPETRDARTSFIHSRAVRFYSNLTSTWEFVNLSLGYTREGDSKLTSKFYPDKDPWFDYGSVGVSLVPTDIQAVKNAIPWLSFAKLRYNYATTGKSVYTAYAIDYAFVSQISTGGGYALGTTGGNQNLVPEITRQRDMGVEFKFLKNRIGIDFTRYSLKSRDQILAARTSYGTGYPLKFINGGVVQNRGTEISLLVTPIQNKKMVWDLTVNYDKNVGEILEMPQQLPFYYDSDTWMFGNARSQAYQGAFTGNIAGYTFAKNKNGDVLIDPSTGYPITDQTFQNIGDRQPDFKMAVINNFTYKGFNLNFNLDFRKGGDVFNANEMYLYTLGLSKKTLDREQPRVIAGVLRDGLENTDNPTRNTIAIVPYYTSTGYYVATAAVSEADFIESVDWMRLRDIALSYKIPANTLKRLGVIKGLTLSVSAQDVFMITNYTGADPNVSGLNASSRGLGGAGFDFGAISSPRRFNVGLRMQL